jgi:acyl-CoA thioesterase FadM
MSSLSKPAVTLSWICQVVAAVILLQTLVFKFTGAAESRFIFSALGVEPWGRIASGVVELVAAALLVYPRTAALGAALAMGVMAGAIVAHLFVLGLEIQGDGGLLFTLAVIVFVCGAIVAYLRRVELPVIGCKFA